jgi:hypothetical protein
MYNSYTDVTNALAMNPPQLTIVPRKTVDLHPILLNMVAIIGPSNKKKINK